MLPAGHTYRPGASRWLELRCSLRVGSTPAPCAGLHIHHGHGALLPALVLLACRIIAENFLEKWWQNLDETLTTDNYVDTRSIHSIMA